MTLKLKYSKELSTFSDCPPKIADAVNRKAFRFVHSKITDQRNFLPIAKLNVNRQFDSDHDCCISHALSLFSSKQTALAKFKEVSKRHKQFHKTVGTHLAEGQIAKDDGLTTPVSRNGHFSLFESTTVDFTSKFSIVGELNDDKT